MLTENGVYLADIYNLNAVLHKRRKQNINVKQNENTGKTYEETNSYNTKLL